MPAENMIGVAVLDHITLRDGRLILQVSCFDVIVIGKSLAAAFTIDDMGQADLAACAETYLRGIGLSDETIAALRQRLGQP